MDALLSIIFLVLLGILGWLCLKFGVINIDPQHIAIRRNVWTGALKELKPGLRFIIPGLHEVFRLVDCRQVILDPESLKVTSRDGQPVDVDYQITLWVDGFYDENKYDKDKDGKPIKDKDGKPILIAKKGEINEGQAIKTVTKIGEQIRTEKQISQEGFKKDLEIIGLKESKVAIQNMIGNYLMGELVGQKLPLTISCPFCGKDIKGGVAGEDIKGGVAKPPTPPQTKCPDETCQMNLKEMEVPAGFYERLSFSSGIRLHNDLGERYGLGCLLKIKNVFYPPDIERAARAERVAEMEGGATLARFTKETEAFKNLIDETGINPNVAFLGGKLMEVIPEIMAAMGGKRKKEQTGKGEEK